MSTSFPVGAELAVLSQSGHTLSFFDLASGRRSDIVPVLPEGHELCFDPVRRRLYASHTYRSGHFAAHDEKGHEVSVIDVDTHQVVEVIDLAPEHGPHALALDAAADLLYVSVEEGPAGPGGLVAIDLRTNEVVARYSADAPVPHWAVLAPDGTAAYTTNKSALFASRIDLTGRTPVRRIPVPGSEGLALSPTGDRLYIATPTALSPPDPTAPHAVKVIDTTTLTTLATIALPATPGSVHVTGTGKLLVGCWPLSGSRANPFADGILSILDAETYRYLGELNVGITPINIISAAEGHLAFVSHLIAGTVTVVDLDAHTPVTTLEVDLGDPGGEFSKNTHHQGAHGLAYIPPRAGV
ncbi:YncE family protein [Streptomyces celluloflavus]|uniref:YncE family protein n=1 Tax=Streptomyces celluloflavus TaxID=58344 RepID=UPI0037913979